MLCRQVHLSAPHPGRGGRVGPVAPNPGDGRGGGVLALEANPVLELGFLLNLGLELAPVIGPYGSSRRSSTGITRDRLPPNKQTNKQNLMNSAGYKT
jgi:hypothetical protein